MKVCTGCGEAKPKSEFIKRAKSKDGLGHRCKHCRQVQWEIYKKSNSEKIKQYYIDNREAACKKSKLWRENNKERYANQMKNYYEKNKELLKQRTIDWTKQNKSRKKTTDKRWRESNPEKYSASMKRYKVSKKNRTPSWLTSEQHDQIESFYEAAFAFRIFTGLEYHVDHIVPLQGKTVSGLHVPANLQVLQSSDNLKKSNLFWPYMW